MDSFDEIPLLDDEQIAMLIDDGVSVSSDLLVELVELYKIDSAELLNETKLSLEKGDFDALKQSAHSFAGSSSNMGGMRAWKVGKALEAEAQTQNKPACQRLIPFLEKTFETTLSALEAKIEEIDSQS